MPGEAFDYAICGTSPFAVLLAGLLARDHRRRVCLIGEPWSPYRLARRVDVSVAPATRPETWTLLKRETPEVLRLLGSMGRGLYERVDPVFVAETPATADRLGHMRWTAAACGFAAERIVDRTVAPSGAICRIRDAAMLVIGRAEPQIDSWLEKTGAVRLPGPNIEVAGRRDGTASIVDGGSSFEAGTVVLADDAALLRHQAPSDRHRLVETVTGVAVVTEPSTKPLPAVLTSFLDRNVVLHQRNAKLPVVAIVTGAPDTAPARLGSTFRGVGPLRRTGQATFRRIETRDGAPLIGRFGRHKTMFIAGLGDTAPFVAMAVARLLVDSAGDEDRAWLEGRDVSRAQHRQSVAEREPASIETAG